MVTIEWPCELIRGKMNEGGRVEAEEGGGRGKEGEGMGGAGSTIF